MLQTAISYQLRYFSLHVSGVCVLQTYVAVRPELKLNITEACEARINSSRQHCQQPDKLQCIIELLDTYRSVTISPSLSIITYP